VWSALGGPRRLSRSVSRTQHLRRRIRRPSVSFGERSTNSTACRDKGRAVNALDRELQLRLSGELGLF
jgi:hypothetical protein